MVTEDRRPCPVCGEDIKASAVKCRFCGEDIAAFVAKKESAVERGVFEAKQPVLYDASQIIVIVLASLCCFFPGLIAALIYWLLATTTSYKITTQRVVVESGVFSRDVQNIELFRVDDVGEKRPFLMRVMGYGYLYLKSSDRTTPEVKIITKKPRDFVEQLREYITVERERNRVSTWANS